MDSIPAKMRAAQFIGPEKLRVEEVDTPEPQEGDVLVRVEKCGICPSDVRAYQGVFRSQPDYPMVTGHEWSGEVVALGPGEDRLSVGDRVVVDWHGPCGFCYYCRKGFPNYCENLKRRQGGFAQYALAFSRSVRILPDDVSFDNAAMCEPLACCFNGIETLHLEVGDNIVVIGCGPIGLMHIQLARSLGARVIGVDLISKRMEIAERLGASDVISAHNDDVLSRVKQLTNGRGANAVIVAVGTPAIVDQAAKMAAPLGRINTFAGFYPDGKTDFDFNLIHYKQITITGSHNYLPRHFDEALNAIRSGMVIFDDIVSHILPLDDSEAGMNFVANQEGLKVLIAPNK
jgi:L-iditol 2-dehydrogenase